MDSKLIPAKLIELHTVINEKSGRCEPPPTMFISARDNKPFWDDITIRAKSYRIRNDTAEGFFKDAYKQLENLPSEAEHELAEFQAKLAELIDLGRKNNIDLDFVNPLIATSKKLAENAITKEK